MQNADLNDLRIIRIRSGSDPILIRIVNFNPIQSADHEFAIRSGSDPNPIRGFESDRIFCGTLCISESENLIVTWYPDVYMLPKLIWNA